MQCLAEAKSEPSFIFNWQYLIFLIKYIIALAIPLPDLPAIALAKEGFREGAGGGVSPRPKLIFQIAE